MSRIILDCNINNFYASVECMLDMNIRGLSLMVPFYSKMKEDGSCKDTQKYRRKKHLKCLSRKDIEEIARRVLKAYYQLPDVAGTEAFRINPELLLTELLGLKIEYAHLSIDRSILGATTTVQMPIEIFCGDNSESSFYMDGKTVLIERDLKEDSTQQGRCNFSLAHESSHQILKMLFPHDYDADPQIAMVHYYRANSEKCKPIKDWYEWQANALASAILLPFEIIDRGIFLFGIDGKIKTLNKIYFPKVYEQFSNLAAFLGVSKTALAIRMKQLGLLENNHLDNPYCLIDVDYNGGK